MSVASLLARSAHSGRFSGMLNGLTHAYKPANGRLAPQLRGPFDDAVRAAMDHLEPHLVTNRSQRFAAAILSGQTPHARTGVDLLSTGDDMLARRLAAEWRSGLRMSDDDVIGYASVQLALRGSAAVGNRQYGSFTHVLNADRLADRLTGLGADSLRSTAVRPLPLPSLRGPEMHELVRQRLLYEFDMLDDISRFTSRPEVSPAANRAALETLLRGSTDSAGTALATRLHDARGAYNTYIEAQVHGPIGPEDVVAIIDETAGRAVTSVP